MRTKIGMAVLCYERPDYLEICLNSLFQTDLHDYDVTFLLNDDGSTDSRVKEIINKERDPKYKIWRNFTPKGLNNAGQAINKAMDKLQTLDDFEIIGWCDPDALFHPDWLDNTMKICQWAKENHKEHILGPFTSFNSSDYEFHKILGAYSSPYGNYVIKRQAGMLNYFYFKEEFRRFKERADDETLMTKYFDDRGIRNFCTETSYVEHIGQESVLNKWRHVPVKNAVHAINLIEDGWPMNKPVTVYKHSRNNKSFGDNLIPSELKLDVVIPVAEKDMAMLPFTIESIKRYLMHPIEHIYIVGKNNKMMLGYAFINEDEVLPVKLSDIKYNGAGKNRSGWIFQQLLKLNVDAISNQHHVLIMDADTILIKPQKFEYDSKCILLAADEFHKPYFQTYAKLLGYRADTLFSFTAHHMLLSADCLKRIKHEIEIKHQKPWYQAIIDVLDPTQLSSFSEYELYGNWMMKNAPEKIMIEYFHNKNLHGTPQKDLDYYVKTYSKEFKSVSLHVYT